MEFLRRLARFFPAFITAFVLALAVWISAVTSGDPTEERAYPQAVPIELIGQNPSLVLTSGTPGSVSLIMSAPQSIWTSLNNDTGAVRAIADLSGLDAGTYVIPVQIQIVPRPVRKVQQSPTTITVTLENLASREFEINLIQRGAPAVGYLADTPELSKTTAVVSGPETQVNRVVEVRAIMDINQSSETINRTINLQALDANEVVVSGVTIVPDRITVSQEISQRFGYRNVVVKVVVSGQVANGYRLTNISVFPPAVTVFSSDPQVVSDLPGFIETLPVDLTGVIDDLDISVALNLPQGISVVGDQTEVLVRVGIAAIESSLTLPAVPLEVSNLGPGLQAITSPETVTVIISGPVALLDRLKASDVRVILNVSELGVGTYQLEPRVEILIPELTVESILPETIEVVISRSSGTASP